MSKLNEVQMIEKVKERTGRLLHEVKFTRREQAAIISGILMGVALAQMDRFDNDEVEECIDAIFEEGMEMVVKGPGAPFREDAVLDLTNAMPA